MVLTPPGYFPCMNDTKWEELRLAMHELGPLGPRYRVRNIDSGFVSDWDGEWFYHFRVGSHAKIEWVDLRVSAGEQEDAVLQALRRIHVPGCRTEDGFKVYGYLPIGTGLDYL